MVAHTYTPSYLEVEAGRESFEAMSLRADWEVLGNLISKPNPTQLIQ